MARPKNKKAYRKETISIALPAGFKDQLEEIAAARKVSISSIVRASLHVTHPELQERKPELQE